MKSFKFTCKGKPVVVYPINTGTVAMKTKAHTIRYNNMGMRLFDIVTDKKFTEDLPVFCWLILHPEGYFLIDTGYDSHVNDPDYFKGAKAIEKWFASTQVKVNMTKEEELMAQLRALGVSLEQISFVILTHLHVDHVGGIPNMKGAKFLVNETELKDNTQAFLLPSWFEPITVSLQIGVIECFPASYTVTEAGDMHMVSTPGHTKGHCSVLLQTDDADILFAGDVVYEVRQLFDDTIAVPNARKSSLNSYKNIRDYGSKRPLVVLPSHDQRSLRRLHQPFEYVIPNTSGRRMSAD